MKYVKCPECGALNEKGTQTCFKCGLPLDEEHEKENLEKEDQSVEAQEDNLSEDVENQKDMSEPPLNEEASLDSESDVEEHDESEGDELKEESIADNNTGKSGFKDKWLNFFHKNKVICCIVGVIFLALIILIVFFAVRGTPVKSVKLEYEEASMEVGDYGEIEYTISPKDATNKKVEWKSSDESIATIDKDGGITGEGEGTCEITITAKNGKSDTCEITVEPAQTDFEKAYTDYCDSSYASIAGDGSYLSIDTNPKDKEDYSSDDAITAIVEVNSALDIPDSVVQKMSSTRAIDGIQSETIDDIEVSWSYHPDKGLEVIYSLAY